MNKLLAGLQIVLGATTVYAAWYLAEIKAWPVTIINSVSGIIVTSAPPDSTLEGFLILVGLGIFGLALVQAVRGINFSNLQMVCGAVILGISSFLCGRATALTYGEISSIYRIAYLPMSIGILVGTTGAMQLFKELKYNSK